MSDILDELLDVTLDDIADLPSFQNYPVGSHHVKANFSQDTINDKPAIKLDFELIESVELANPEDEPPKAGDKCGLAFFLDNEFGLGNFKKAAKPFGEALSLSTLREIVEGVKDVECVITTGLRLDKKGFKATGEKNYYLDLKDVKVL